MKILLLERIVQETVDNSSWSLGCQMNENELSTFFLKTYHFRVHLTVTNHGRKQ